MDPAKPSLALVRAVTDEQVLRALIRHRRLTRAELAADIGISKPTAGESVRRLAERGLVVDTGEHTPGGRGRGRVGSYYALSVNIGSAMAVSIAPEGVVAEGVDVYGTTVVRDHQELGRPARQSQVAAALRDAATEVALTRPVRLAVVSAADPVDRATGRLVHLPDAPFLVGDLDPVTILAPYVVGRVLVDNDVNWAAKAERDHAGPDFAYLHLGEGLGAAVVSDGEVRRGSTGLAGEVAYLLTTGPSGEAVRFIDLFAQLELRQPGSTAIDVERLLERCADADTRRVLGQAVGGVIAALAAICDPDRVIVGGSWGPELLDDIPSPMPRQPVLQAATQTTEPGLTGARAEALSLLAEAIATG
ncbi:ROK family transcriptional regulator [Amycolatopsis albispora]|uniref:ArsR family transcriptional regulator n=1 Tax=Amycolatopsis albispora TaxID=1804986 RepID=A0A344L9K8_9PSEU|nr:ROK family transcriptional regulator [Amycolatopsis albispora]AXB44732.1 ArsR family transcriptional regulator [Amycolatopsis albispora]